MIPTPLEAAVLRLERAVRRLERQPRPTAPAAMPAEVEALVRLQGRHDRLRLRVEETIRTLDHLIATGGEVG